MMTGFVIALAGGLLLGADGTGSAKGGDQEKLQGKWIVTSGVMDGAEIPKDQLKGQMTFKGNKYAFTSGEGEGEAGSGTFRIDPSRNPKTMDAVPADGPAQGQTVEEIYELKGDTLKICLTLPGTGGKRPTEFNSTEGSGRWLFTYRRAK